MASGNDNRARARCLRLAVVLMLLVPPALAGCRHGSHGPAAVKIGMVLAGGSQPYYQAVRKAAEAFAREKQCALTVADGADQATAIGELVQQGVNVLILRPGAGKLDAAVAAARTAGVYTVLLERPVPGVEAASIIGFNQQLAGQVCADYLRRRLPSGGRVLVLQARGETAGAERAKAFQGYLKGAPGWTVAGEQTVASAAEGRDSVEGLMRSGGGLQAVFAANDELVLGAAVALHAAGGQGLVVGYGGSPDAVKALGSGGPAMIACALPQQLGTSGARVAWRIATNAAAPSRLRLPVFPVTGENAGAYPGWEKLLPRELLMPWPSSLELKAARDD